MKTLNFSKKNVLFSLIAFAFLASFFVPGPAALLGLKLATIPVSGNFDCADLLVVQGKADQIWMDNATKQDYVPKADALKIIYEQTTAQLVSINGEQSKDNTIKLIWVDACDIEGQECSTTECIIEGEELSADCKTLTPNICYTVPFKVNEDTLRTSIFSPEELIAKGMLKATKILDEYMAQQIIAAIDTFKGVNVYPGDYGTVTGGGTVGNSDTTIASNLWTASLLGYFNLASQINKFNNPFLLSGSNLAIANWNAVAEGANADGKGNLNKFQSMTTYFDLFNMDSTFNPDLVTFMLDKGAVAFAPKWRYSSTPRQIIGANSQTRYTVPSRTLPNVYYDVIYSTQCKAGTNQIEHLFNVTARGGIYLNPTGCTATKTGVLRFEKV